jgi:hypothetical protein
MQNGILLSKRMLAKLRCCQQRSYEPPPGQICVTGATLFAQSLYKRLELRIPRFFPWGEKTEREGFEPSVLLRAHWFSKPARSAAPTPLRKTRLGTLPSRPRFCKVLPVNLAIFIYIYRPAVGPYYPGCVLKLVPRRYFYHPPAPGAPQAPVRRIGAELRRLAATGTLCQYLHRPSKILHHLPIISTLAPRLLAFFARSFRQRYPFSRDCGRIHSAE